MEAKQMLLLSFGERLGDILTANAKDDVLAILSEELGGFELEHNRDGCSDSEGAEYLDAYLSAKLIEGRSEKTIERYRYIITRMLNGIGVPLRNISPFHVRSYLAREKERGISDTTLNGVRETISAFSSWLNKEGLLHNNFVANVGAIKCQKKQRRPYSDVDIEKLKEHCGTDRNKAIISFLLSTGCRISEVCSLDRNSVDLSAKECVVLGKGNKERTVYIDDVTVMYLRRYLEGRKDDHKALFVGKGSERLTAGGVRFMLHRVAEKANVENTHPHRFRRTLATSLIDHGMPIQEVAMILGHDKLDTTMKYVFIDKKNVRNSYRKYN